MKRITALFLTLMLLLAALPVQADGMWFPEVFQSVDGVLQLNLDNVWDEYQNTPEYQEMLTFSATQFTVCATLPDATRDRPLTLNVWRVDKNELVYSKTLNQWKRNFVSGKIETPYTGQANTQYRVELICGNYYRSVVVTRELIYLTNNTVSARGIRFRDLGAEFVREPITDKWYMFTPVDLYTLSPYGGTEVYPLFASNMYVVGSLVVTRQGDYIYVQAYPDMDVYMRNCYVTFFPNLSSVSSQMLSNSSMRKNGFAMGEPIGIYADLEANGMQLLYFSAVIDFDPNSKEKLEDWYDARDVRKMKELLRQIESGMGFGNG